MVSADLNFAQFGQRNPCVGCPAPCCRLQLIPHKTPSTFMDIDFVHYMLLFPRTEMAVTRNGDWFIVQWETCREFEADTFACKVHNTSQKPRTCTMYNPYNCWYKKSFVSHRPSEVYRLDLARFGVWVNEIHFAGDGRITLAPNFERSQEMFREMPIETRFELLTDEEMASDFRVVAAQQATE